MSTMGDDQQVAGEKHYITGIDLAKNFGQHAALMAGFHYANGDIIICLDDDGQAPADEVDKLTEGYDVVYASYEKKMQASFRNFGSMVNSKMMEIMLGKPRDLVINSYLGMRRFIMEVRPFFLASLDRAPEKRHGCEDDGRAPFARVH